MRTLVHLSDLHFGRIDPGVLEPLRSKLFELDPDLVVVSGDLTQRARRRQFREAREYLETLPKPQLIVPGNHDVPLYDVVRRFVSPLGRYKRILTDDLQPEFIDDEIAVVGINTARSLVFKGGRINSDQAKSVRGVVCELGEHVVKIVVSHHPFDAPEGSGEEDQIVGRARMALEILAGCGVDVFLSGHLHESHIGHTSQRYNIAGVHALIIQAGTATSNRLRGGEKNSFNVLRVTSRHIEVERFVLESGAFVRASIHGFDHDDHGGWTPSS
jgi:3',5'-cyclic AMP phosphodiesterase CpdA